MCVNNRHINTYTPQGLCVLRCLRNIASAPCIIAGLALYFKIGKKHSPGKRLVKLVIEASVAIQKEAELS